MAKRTDQEWTCDKCGVNGIVYVWVGQDVMSVVNRIRDQHKELSPECDNPVRKIRVLNFLR